MTDGDDLLLQGGVTIRYRNHKGEVSERAVVPRRLWYGECAWHPGPQWLLEAFDLGKNARRTFALRDVLAWGGVEVRPS